MSLKGVQDGVKDGGAHSSTHDSHIDNEILVAESLFENGIAFTQRNSHIGAPARSIQNGGQSEDTECTVSELLSDCDDSFTISDNNVIWLKSRCKNISGDDFDCGVKDAVDSDSELFGGHMPEMEGGGGIDDGLSRKDEDNDKDKAMMKNGSDSNVCDEDFANQGVTVHFGDFASVKNSTQEVFPIHIDLENFRVKSDSVALMTPQELESLPNRGLEFEDSLVSMSYSSPNYNSPDLNTDSSVKSDSTKETDNSLDMPIKIPSEIVSSLKNESETLPPLNIDAESKQLITIDPLENSQIATLSPSGSSSSSSSSSPSTTVTSAPSSTTVTESQTDQPNLALATISISTDKAANSTQILVHTNQGQQLYLINTADLTQATNALQPLAQPAAATSINKPTTPSEVFSSPPPPPQPRLETPAPPTQEVQDSPSQLQPLPLQIQSSGYFLVPVGQEGTNSGLLVTTPLTAISPEIVCQSRKVWMCPENGCDKVFRKLSKLKIHQMRHTGERPFKCSRDGCDWAFTTAYKLKRHEESHEGRKDYNCDFPGCGRKFTTVYNLNSHRKLHERPCTETCPEPDCGQSFPTKRQLDLHVRTHTGLEKTYKCPVSGCDKVFFSPNCMGSHTRVHLMDRQDLTCKFEGCGKVFDKQCRLKQHERRHTGEKPYVCQYQGCTWAFTTASKLKRHKAKHTGLRKWVCSVCNKGFMRAEHLKGHLVTHSGVKPFICPVEGCKARFTAKSSLYVHFKKHDKSGKKITYHCPMEGCVRNYSSKAGLRNHILKHYLSTPSGGDPSTALDWVPLLGGDEDGNLDNLVQASADAVTGLTTSQKGSSSSLTPPVMSVSTSSKSTIPTAEFVSQDGDCLSAEQLSSNIVSQLIANSPLQPQLSLAPTSVTPMITDQSPSSTTTPLTTIKTQPKIAIAADGASLSTVALENSSGSARTDYRSNHMLSERARRRWHRVKNGGTIEEEDNDVLDTALSDSVLEKTSDPASPLFSDDMLSSSQGVMFRDPETGITYVQTQLLQDDPPHPAVYDDESNTASATGTVSFTGTTINLQDLK